MMSKPYPQWNINRLRVKVTDKITAQQFLKENLFLRDYAIMFPEQGKWIYHWERIYQFQKSISHLTIEQIKESI